MKKTFFLISILSISLMLSCGDQQEYRSDNKITINPDKTSTPISPYIYGQFIEHLGRCIYGGIWAEMLEDRKFYYPVTADYSPWGTRSDPYWNAGEFPVLEASPWKIIGSPEAVKMTGDKPFTGEHDPVIILKGDSKECGISQEGLVFEANREYTGSIYLAASAPEINVRLSVRAEGIEPLAIAEFSGLGNDYSRHEFKFSSQDELDEAWFEITGTGTGSFRIGTVSLMPSDNVDGFNKEVLSYLRELNAPIYRWPGGNFVSGYNWKDGIGDRDRRPPRKNPAWTGIEPNDVGIHEYMQLCQLIDTEPFICVNTGLGTVDEVAEQVEYCNGTTDTPMGKWRSENGKTEPYKVKFWAVGNEMYGEWQLGHMPLEEYVKKHNRVAEAMWKVDPGIQLVAVGSAGEWSKTMLSQCADHMNLLSEHIYCKEEKDVMAHVRQIPDNISRVANIHRNYRDSIPDLAGKQIRIAMDEWNYWHGDYIYGELGCRYFMKDALGIAAGFHEYFRNSDLFFMANYAQTVNVIGAIKTTKKDVEFAATGMVLKLYRNHFGSVPVSLQGIPEPLDISAALDEEKKHLTLAIVNPDSVKMDFNFEILGFADHTITEILEISNPDPMSYNAPGEPRRIDIKTKQPNAGNYLDVPSYSISLVKIDMQ